MPVRRRKRMDLTLPTSSMGDIAFLLIIFFVLASHFMKTANIEAEKPTSEAVDTVAFLRTFAAGKIFIAFVVIV